MKINVLNSFNESKQLNPLNKDCLKNIESYDYANEVDSMSIISIEDNVGGGKQIATLEICLPNEKAGMQIVRMKTKDKNLEKQKEVLKEFTNYVWDVANINHLVLAINVFVEGSGIDYSVLERLGFIGRNGIGSILYTLLNPNYMELVETFAKDSEAIQKLTAYYDKYQMKKNRQLERLERELKYMILDQEECENLNQQEREFVQNHINYCTEAINSLKTGERDIKRR